MSVNVFWHADIELACPATWPYDRLGYVIAALRTDKRVITSSAGIGETGRRHSITAGILRAAASEDTARGRADHTGTGVCRRPPACRTIDQLPDAPRGRPVRHAMILGEHPNLGGKRWLNPNRCGCGVAARRGWPGSGCCVAG